MKAQPQTDDDATTSWILTATKLIESLCERIEVLEAKQFADTTQAFIQQTTTVRELDELRRTVVSEPPRQWLTVREAAKLCGRSHMTLRTWCTSYRIGVLVDGIYQVDIDRLRRMWADRFGADTMPVALRD
jgi:hypothetical protein